MVGGVIAGLTMKEGEIHVHVEDCCHYPKHPRGACPRPDSCCVYTDGIKRDGTAAAMKVGDSFWWQCGYCYWTPAENRNLGDDARGGVDYDIQLKKIGYSH